MPTDLPPSTNHHTLAPWGDISLTLDYSTLFDPHALDAILADTGSDYIDIDVDPQDMEGVGVPLFDWAPFATVELPSQQGW